MEKSYGNGAVKLNLKLVDNTPQGDVVIISTSQLRPLELVDGRYHMPSVVVSVDELRALLAGG